MYSLLSMIKDEELTVEGLETDRPIFRWPKKETF